jgi:hypothetical protein
MSLIENLKVVAWRQSNWNKLFLGSTLFTEIKALNPIDLESALSRLEMYQQSLPNKLSEEKWRIAKVIFTCARIANLDSYSYKKLPDLLQTSNLSGEMLTHDSADFDKFNQDSWFTFIRGVLEGLTWFNPISAAWAWDTLNHFWKRPRKEINSQRLTLLLLGKDHAGITADLTLDLLDDGDGTLYPDPETMSFVTQGDKFIESQQNAINAIQQRGTWAYHKDVRWKIERQDGKPIQVLDGGSAGATFALGLSKLYTQSTPFS